MSKNRLISIQVRLCIDVEVHYFSRSRTYDLRDQNNERKVGLIIDVKGDGNFKFFSSFYEGDPQDASIVLKDKDEIIQKLQNGVKKISLELQIHEKVMRSTASHFYIPKKEDKAANVFLCGELKETYSLYMYPEFEKLSIYCFGYWGELLEPEPKNLYDFLCYGYNT